VRWKLRAASTICGIALAGVSVAQAQAPQKQQAEQRVVPPPGPYSGNLALPPAPPAGIPVVPPLPVMGASGDMFSRAMTNALPLSPDQIKEVNRGIDSAEKAKSAKPGPAAKPVVSSISLSLAPGNEPHVVRLGSNATTSLVFTDATGSPWPVVAAVSGDKDAFAVLDVSKAIKNNNAVTLSASRGYATSNLTIFLEGAPAPLVLGLVSGQKQVDYRLDVSIQGRSPLSQQPVMDRGFSDEISPVLLRVIDGNPPTEAKQLKVDQGAVQAWFIGGKLFVRTKLLLTSPAALKVASAADGTKAYELPRTEVLLLVSGGTFVTANVTGFPQPQIDVSSGQRTAK